MKRLNYQTNPAKENILQTVSSSYYNAYTILLTQYPVVVEDFAHLHANVLDDQVDVEFVNLEVIFAVLVGWAYVPFYQGLDITCNMVNFLLVSRKLNVMFNLSSRALTRFIDYF